ncbi:unnamed protein product [Penicillium olsonii]|nr:unnamed protein product [Penicillium olsonii]
MPSRKSYGKSHHGCLQCKQRRIKCDETRPHCGSCRKKHISCTFESYHPQDFRPWGFSAADPGRSTSSTSSLALGDLELLNHWHTAVASSLAQNEALVDVFQTHVPHKGISYPFLMHGILAISALHISREMSDSRCQKYATMAIQHHTLSLSLSALNLSHITPANCHALFACSLLIASFSFGYRGSDTPRSMTMGEVISTLQLLRGSASIAETARPWIERGDLKPLLKFTRGAHQSQTSQVNEIHTRLKALLGLQANAWLFKCQRKPVVQKSIQKLMDVVDSYVATENPRTILAWPTMIEAEYLDLVLEKEPMSLVTLAHYGALLHLMTKAWWMKGWGETMVNLAKGCLDMSLQSAIAWPLAVINNSGAGE